MTSNQYKVLTVNPGGTSTKVALFEGDVEVFGEEIGHGTDELDSFDSLVTELPYRLGAVKALLQRSGVDLAGLHAVSGRGGPYAPCPGGAFIVDEPLLEAFEHGHYMVEHPSLLGAPMAFELARESGCPAYIVDPVSVDEFVDEARVTGLPEIHRKSLGHALSIKSALRQAAASHEFNVETSNAVVLHLGSGFTVAALKNGKKVDSTDASASGPIAPTRTGQLPALDLVRLAFSGKYTLEEFYKLLVGKGGWTAHLGTADIREIYKRIDEGCDKSKSILDATFYQLAKETAALASVLNGNLDVIVITGGVAHSNRFVDELKGRIAWLCSKTIVLPGEKEMSALCTGAIRVLTGETPALSMKIYLSNDS